MTAETQPSLFETARRLVDMATSRNFMLATAESCTGGLIAATLTEIAGSSAVVDRGFVTYSNEAKVEMLGVDLNLIRNHGAVSSQVAKAMAEGALERSKADIAISVTGVAGPGGGSPEKPIGLVFSAIAAATHETIVFEDRFGERDRRTIRLQTVARALARLSEAI